jgi:transposase-like protein
VPFSHTEKQQAVIQLGSRDGSAVAVAERIGVSRCTLYNWRDQLLDEKAKPTLKKSKDKPASGEADALRAEVKALEKRVHELQLEHDILVKASELVKKANGVNPRTLSNREKTRLVDALQETYRLQELLTAVNLPRSSYYYHREALRRPDKYAEARQAIARIFDNNYRCYGYRRVSATLFVRTAHHYPKKWCVVS